MERTYSADAPLDAAKSDDHMDVTTASSEAEAGACTTTTTITADADADEPLSAVHESVLAGVLSHLDTRSKLTLMSTCRALRDLCSRPEVWARVAFDDASQQHNLTALQLVGVLKRARGAVEELRLAR